MNLVQKLGLVRTYTYDPFNRLIGSNKNSGQAVYSYVYDRFGNRWQQNGAQTFLATFTGNNPGTPRNNNRMDGYSYDAAGNLLNDGVHSYTYDAENHMTAVDGGTTATFVYDAEGNRVQKNSNFDGYQNKIFLYDQSGHPIQEFTPAFWQGNIYAGSRHLATVGPATTFSHSDWLGTERVRTTYAGALCESIASLPFGDGQSTTGACYHASPLHFTGKQRDPESNLDNFGARYDSSSFGRFMTADPMGGHQEDPQTMNRYSYVRNNPLNLTDPTRLDFYLQCTDEKHNGCTQVQIDPKNKNTTWVQAGKDGNATIITSDSIREGTNKATVDENGVQINGKNQGIYFENAASDANYSADGKDHNSITLDGRIGGALEGFGVTINGNCSGTCLSSGTWSYPGSLEDARAALYGRHSFMFPGEDEKADLGYGDHPYSTQHRFGGSTCSVLSCPNSPHLSVPNSWVPVPKDTVPQGFHVDAHGDPRGHRRDVERHGVE